MDKKTLMIVSVIGIVIVVLVAIVMGMEIKDASPKKVVNASGETKTVSTRLTSEEVLRLNDNVYTKEDFMNYIKYRLYSNDGEISVDEEQYAEQLANGTSKENIFISETLNEFYYMKAYLMLAEEKNVVLSGDALTKIEEDYENNAEKITKFGLEKDDYIDIATQDGIYNLIKDNPKDYVELSDTLLDQGYLSQYSGDDLNSYTYRMIRVSYTDDRETESGDIVSGDKNEKKALMDGILANINNGMSFADASESGEDRIVMNGNSIEFAKNIQEHSAGFMLEQKMGSKEIANALKNVKEGEMTEIIDTGSSYEIALLEKVEEGIVGVVKDEVVELIITGGPNEVVLNTYVKTYDVNNSAISRIKIK